MTGVVLAPAARVDLEEIGSWIARDSVDAALSFVDELLDACEALQTSPEKFPRVEGRPQLRARSYASYVIIYRTAPRLEVVRVLHSARDWMSLLDDLR
jgi:toxin ParE1/3/4